MNAPRYSTADIAKNAQAAERESEQVERDRERGEIRERLEDRENKEQQRVDAVRQESADRETAQRASTTARTAAVTGAAAAAATAPARPAAAARPAAQGDTAEMNAALFAPDAAQGFRTRWDTIQASFVDDPRRAVQEADALVAEAMQRLADTFAKERSHLEQQFERDTNVSTEDLRVTLRHYRSFFTRLLAV